MGDWDSHTTQRVDQTLWDAPTPLECSRVYFRRLRSLPPELRMKDLYFLDVRFGEPGGCVPAMWLHGGKVPIVYAEEDILRYFSCRGGEE